ncbi:hypothetical protein [Aurantibacter sp.]|uniref:tetratricopeptide repeat protein n=1 Tax=Aurantibacter sp. TaxID=2807103 RepID=UPI0032657641
MDKEELINGYIEGSLSESQLEEVTHLLNTDSEFASDLKFEEELKISLKIEERQELKDMFATLNTKKEFKKGKLILMRPWLAAASIALVVGLTSWFFFFNNSSANLNELYISNFSPYENVVHPIERGNQIEDLMTRAFTAYEDEDYTKALELFKELNVKNNDSYIDFYEAIILMQLNRHEESVALLNNYIQQNGELKDRAHWYLALTYLKLDDVAKSKVELQKLITLGSFKLSAAQELLVALE